MLWLSLPKDIWSQSCRRIALADICVSLSCKYFCSFQWKFITCYSTSTIAVCIALCICRDRHVYVLVVQHSINLWRNKSTIPKTLLRAFTLCFFFLRFMDWCILHIYVLCQHWSSLSFNTYLTEEKYALSVLGNFWNHCI